MIRLMTTPIRHQICTLIALLFVSTLAIGQNFDDLPVYDYGEAAQYEIAGINIKGAESRDRNALLSITGLKVGQKVSIPGDDIPNAVKSLLKLRLFEDVQVVQDSLVGDLIYLQVFIQERHVPCSQVEEEDEGD